MPWITDGRYSKLAIVGICKNAGKTTLLNNILSNHQHKWGILTTGRDGEQQDVLYKTPKPQVKVPAGDLFCCSASVLVGHGSAVDIVAKTPWSSGGKPLWIATAMQELETEIAGPGTAETQLACANLLQSLGAEKVIIDGSLDRKSIVLSTGIDAIILVVGASYGNTSAIITELTRLVALSSIKQVKPDSWLLSHPLPKQEIMVKRDKHWQATGYHSIIGHEAALQELLATKPEVLYIPGAFSSNSFTRLGKHFGQTRIVFRHAECLKLAGDELGRFLARNKVSCLIPFNIKAVAVNAQAVGTSAIDADELISTLRTRFPDLDIFDVMEVTTNV